MFWLKFKVFVEIIFGEIIVKPPCKSCFPPVDGLTLTARASPAAALQAGWRDKGAIYLYNSKIYYYVIITIYA